MAGRAVGNPGCLVSAHRSGADSGHQAERTGRISRAGRVLEGIGVDTVSPTVIARAASYPDSELRSLDAIHLATAEHVASATTEALDAFLAYDERLVAAARKIGLPAAAPGISTTT